MTPDPILIYSLSEYVYQTIVVIHQSHPEWFNEKYQRYPWQNSSVQVKFTSKLRESLKLKGTEEDLINQLVKVLKIIFLPPFFLSHQFTELLANLRKYSYTHLESFILNCGLKNLDSPFAILLFDAENLNLDVNVEKIIAKICHYPVKIRLAFANWRSLGKRDIEFHNRGYEMIHVPSGKNSADLKMISFGLSIWSHYPKAKEVIVCSSDGDLNHLCTTLLNHGLNVYRVSRQANKITVLNSQTGQLTSYSLSSNSEFPPLPDLVSKIKTIIQENTSSESNWLKLDNVLQLFETKYNLNLIEILQHYFPKQTTQEIFLSFKKDFAIHQISENSQLYISVFNLGLQLEQEAKKDILELKSKEDLEKAVFKIVQALSAETKQEYLQITHVASEFQKKYKISITTAMKNLQAATKYVKLLQSYPSLKLKKEGNIVYVAIAKPTS